MGRVVKPEQEDSNSVELSEEDAESIVESLNRIKAAQIQAQGVLYQLSIKYKKILPPQFKLEGTKITWEDNAE